MYGQEVVNPFLDYGQESVPNSLRESWSSRSLLLKSCILWDLCPGDCTAHGGLPLQFYSVDPDGNAMHVVEQLMYVCHFLKVGGDILRLSGSSCCDLLDFLSVVWTGLVLKRQVPTSNIVPVTVLPSSTLTKWSDSKNLALSIPERLFKDVSVVICD